MSTDPMLPVSLRMLMVDALPGIVGIRPIKVRAVRSMHWQCTSVSECQGLPGHRFYGG